jgi:hypothetical protein
LNKYIVSVGFPIPGHLIEEVDYRSSRSLLDADVVLFSPDLYGFLVAEIFQGKSRIADSDSPILMQCVKHWHNELTLALEAGKTVFVFLRDIHEVFVATGESRNEGTGRLARRINIVEPLDPYSSIPIPSFQAAIHRTKGSRIRPTKDIGVLVSYWRAFGPYTTFQINLNKPIGIPSLVTQTGDRMVGGIVQVSNFTGRLILLPPPEFDLVLKAERQRTPEKNKEAMLSGDTNAGPRTATKKKTQAKPQYLQSFVSHLLEIDKTIRAKAETTPTPAWAKTNEYTFVRERECAAEIAAIKKEIDDLLERESTIAIEATAVGNLRGLLFESGKALEGAIIEALCLMGFKAANFSDGDSEFDIVFEDPDGMRFIGEAEGKNDKWINIDKLAQLERNVQEDFAKRQADEYSKPVLFGNAHRFLPPAERGPYFTEKCIKGSQRAKAALVRTPDLFTVTKYLREHADKEYAALCRVAIRDTSGEIVQFPPPPSL